MNVREATEAELAGWDARTVDAPGGHVYQSRAWADHRARSGWRARFLMTGDDGAVLALVRPWPIVPGAGGYVPRGPVAGPPDILGRRLTAVAGALASDGVDVLAADAEVPAAATDYRSIIEAAGFHPIEEIQPSRHRVTRPIEPGLDEDAALATVAKSARQRIRAAERDGIAVVRHDVRMADGGAGDGFVKSAEPTAQALDRFYDLLLETGERRHFGFGSREAFVPWWNAAHTVGHLVALEARLGGADGQPLAGLLLYRHGGRLSTVHSADHADTRRDHPGSLHLLRWRALQLAIREGCSELDLGGADVAGARREPRPGEPMEGLYQHKRAFGGVWLELTGAHERVVDARGYALGRLAGRLGRLVPGMGKRG